MIDMDDEVRQMLQRRADGVTPAPDGWERILDKLDGEAMPVLAVHRARRMSRLMTLTSVAAVVLVALGVTAALLADTTDSRVRTGDMATPADTPDPQIAGSTPPEKPIWPLSPADFGDGLAGPRDAAAAYLAERFAQKIPYAVGEFQADDDDNGRVLYRSPPDSDKQGSVAVRKAGEHWVVMSSTTEALNVHMASYTGTDLSAEMTPTVAGKVLVAVLPMMPDGVLLATQTFEVNAEAGRAQTFSREVGGAASLIVEMRLLDSKTGRIHLTEFRVESPVFEQAVSGSGSATASASARRAPPDRAAEAMERWIDLVADAKMDQAYDLLTPEEQRWGDRRSFRSMESELVEGWGSWRGSRDAIYESVRVDAGLTVATVRGTRSAEGVDEYGIAAMRVEQVDGQWRVDPFSDLTELQLNADDPFTAKVPAGSKAWFVMGTFVVPAKVSGTTARVSPAPQLGEGRHEILLVVRDRNGRVGFATVAVTRR